MMLTLSGKPLDLSNNGTIRSIPELCDATLILQGAASVVDNLLDHLELTRVVISFGDGERMMREGPFPVVKRRGHTAYQISLECGR